MPSRLHSAVVAGEIGVEVRLAGLVFRAVAQRPQHHTGDKAACLDLVPVDAALPAGNVHNGEHVISPFYFMWVNNQIKPHLAHFVIHIYWVFLF